MTEELPVIGILMGGPGAEHEVSLASGRAVAEGLKAFFPVECFEFREARLPMGLRPDRHLILPLVHGTYGEDGTLQAELEARGFAFCGSNAASSRLCIDKVLAKERARECGVSVSEHVVFAPSSLPDAEEVINQLGSRLVLKPATEGSSVGLFCLEGETELRQQLAEVKEGTWMLETRLRGHDATVGVLDGDPLGVVEILPAGGLYDYSSKYTPGKTDYRFPAHISEATTHAMREAARAVYVATGCRDFARVDFILSPNEDFTFLEINTLPGMTATSLLPKSALCQGIDFSSLLQRMCTPGMRRFESRRATLSC